MTVADEIRDHQARCHPHLLRLRLLTQREASTTAPRQIVAEVREATNAVLTEAEAAIRTALSAADRRRKPATETFLWVRLARLAEAADGAVNAAHGAHAYALRTRLRRFDELTSAIWTVQDAVCGQVPLPRPSPDIPEHYPERVRGGSTALAIDRAAAGRPSQFPGRGLSPLPSVYAAQRLRSAMGTVISR
jgi:hypothetical protein